MSALDEQSGGSSAAAHRRGTVVDWSDSQEQATFRQQVRAFVQERLPEHYRYKAEGVPDEAWSGGWQTDRVSDDPEVRNASTEWATALGERGWVASHWPEEYGGAGLSSMEQFILQGRSSRKLGAPSGRRGARASQCSAQRCWRTGARPRSQQFLGRRSLTR